jgi:uncharacterized protein (TIGR03067 family)
VTVGAGLVLALILAAPAGKDGSRAAPAADHPLVGEWVVESHVASGKPLPRVGKVERVTVTRYRWRVSKESETESFLSLDRASDPPQIDVWVPDQQGEVRCRSLYKIDADTLTVCYTLGPDRPTKFESLPKSGVYLLTLKRVAGPK